jgi:lathosterol oxidase
MPEEFINFGSWSSIALFTAINFAVIFLRYVLVSFIFKIVFSVLLKDRYASRRISDALRKPNQNKREIIWSAITSFIFTLSFIGVIWLYQNGKTAIYTNLTELGIWYLPASLFIAMLVHETYYYFLHRWMHKPNIFKLFHYVHHESIVTSPWTAFSFHPIESVLQALIVPAIIIFIPMHAGVIFFMLILMTITATINHLHIEIYPKDFADNWFGKWWIGSSHHSLHHSKYRFNYGLYFTFMDKWFGTESPDYLPLFEDKTED